MQQYSNAGNTNMHIMHKVANSNATEMVTLYLERYSNMAEKQSKQFECLHRQFLVIGSFLVYRYCLRQTRSIRMVNQIKAILDEVEHRPE